MPTLGLVSITFRQLTPAQIIPLVKEAGLTAIEWGSDVHVPQTDLENARRVGEMTREAGLTVSSYGSYYRLGTGQDFLPYLDAAEALGAPIIRIWAGTKNADQVDWIAFLGMVAEAKAIARMAAERGITIAFEYHHGTLTDTGSSALSLVQAVNEPNCRLYWQPEFSKSWRTLMSDLEKVASYVEICHVFKWTADHTRLPLKLGFGDWVGFLNCVLAWGDKPLLLEFVPGDDPAVLTQEADALREIVSYM